MVNTLNPPLEVIQSWPKPNYANPETRGEGLFIISIVLAWLGILMVTARLYSRFFITKAPGFDDALIVFALLFAIALSVLVCIGNKFWFSGHHVWDIPLDKYVGHRLNVWIAQLNYVSALSCVKISVLLFYRRLSVTFSRTFMIATWIGIIYNLLYWLGFCLALLLTCQPVKAYWFKVDREWAATHDWRCGSEQIALPFAGALSVIGDFYSALLPMLLIMGLDLPRRQKMSLYALFAIAFLVVAAGVARTVLVNTVINKDYDFTWVLWEMWIWGEVELYVALLAASAPALKPFLRRFLVEPMTSADASSRKRGAGYGDQYGDRLEMQRGFPIKRDLDDPERIGVAYGGYETKSREESLVKELDDVELETRHFELRHSRDGRKMVPTQIWKRGRNIPSTKETDDWPVPPIDSTHQQYQQHQDERQGHVRNFSQPHSYKSSGDTTKELLQQVGRSHIVSQISPVSTHRQSPDPHILGQTHVQRRLSQGSGSVKQGRLRAQQQQKTSPKEPSLTRVPQPPNSRNTSYSEVSPPPQYQSQGLYFPHLQPILDKRDALRQVPYAARAKGGRGSRLEPPSEDSGSDDGYSSDRRYQRQQEEAYEPPWMHVRGEMQNQMYVVEKPSWQHTSTLKSASSAADHNRSSSEETLALPRMGSIDDFNKERVDAERIENQRRREAELNAARARVAMRETEREMERGVEMRRHRGEESEGREGSRDRARWRQ